MADVDMLTPSEAAVIASVSVRDVHRMIDEEILPERFYILAGGRRIHVTACPLIGFYVGSAQALTAEERSRVVLRLSEVLASTLARKPAGRQRNIARTARSWRVRDRFLTVDLSEFAAAAESRRAELAEAREMVVQDPEILSGTPVVRGTRVPVYDLAASVSAGRSPDRVCAAYSGITERQVKLAALYAEATPPRGRPRRAPLAGLELRVAPRHRAARHDAG